jgi:hypothetical protein
VVRDVVKHLKRKRKRKGGRGGEMGEAEQMKGNGR